MPEIILHGSLRAGMLSGIHAVHDWEVPNAAARTALVVDTTHVGKVCRQLDAGGSFWLLAAIGGGGPEWRRIDGGASAGMTPEQTQALADAVAAIAALRGPTYIVEALTSELLNERTLEGTGPVTVSFATAAKAIITIATALGGGTPAAGLMSAADKVAFDAAMIKLAGIADGANVGPLVAQSAPPVIADTTSGIGTTSGTPRFATQDHTHGHGTRGGGTLHATALGGGSPAAGFMSGADKVAHDTNTTYIAGIPALLATKANRAWTDNPQAGNYTLTAADPDRLTRMTSAVANTVTVPPDTTFIPERDPVNVIRYGAGITTITAGAGVTLLPANNLRLVNQYDMATLIRVSANTWLVKGEAVT